MYNENQNSNDPQDFLGNITRAKAPDFFQTRLMARLEKEVIAAPPSIFQRILKPIPVLTLLVFLAVLNLYTLSDTFLHKEKTKEPSKDNISGFASEYQIFNTVDFNN